MATMNVSLPDPMKDWVEAQARIGPYSNASDYVRDLIRRDREREASLHELQQRITQGIDSEISDVLRAARDQAGVTRDRDA